MSEKISLPDTEKTNDNEVLAIAKEIIEEYRDAFMELGK